MDIQRLGNLTTGRLHTEVGRVLWNCWLCFFGGNVEKIWDIKLYQTKNGYKVKIEGEGGCLGQYKKVEAEAPTPHKAYRAAECQLVVKPWLTSNEEDT